MPDWLVYRERLQREERRLEREIERLNRLGLENGLKDSVNELSSYDNHPADLASETFEREKDLGLLDNLRIKRRNVSRALERMSEGKYGICEQCGEPIDPERLEALPETALCVGCQAKLEELTSERERPLEEETLGPPFSRTFLDGDDNAAFDGEDAWQAVARYGTSETPQDIGENAGSYEEMYLGHHEHPGVVEGTDDIVAEEYPGGIPPDPLPEHTRPL